jgi:TonB family protein
MLKRLLFLLLMTSCSLTADSPKRIERQVAEQNLTNKIEPIVPPLAKTLEIGGTVSLEITISPDGKVGSVKVLSGHPMLAPAFVDAVKKWEYRPFVQDNPYPWLQPLNGTFRLQLLAERARSSE